MKNKLLIVLTLMVALSITACSNTDTKEPIEDKDKTPVEDVQESDEDQDLDTPEDKENLDKDEDEIQEEETKTESPVKDDSNKEVSSKWPEAFMEKAPKLKGQIELVKEEGPDKYFIKFKNIKYDDAIDYINSIKEAGFTENSNEHLDINSLKYKGMDSEKDLMIFHWSKGERAELSLIKKNN